MVQPEVPPLGRIRWVSVIGGPDSSAATLVRSLFVKMERGAPMTDSSDAGIHLDCRLGVRGDYQAGPLGPRQVLLVAGEGLDLLGLGDHALRANIVTRGIALEMLESGTLLDVGPAAQVRLTHRCEVCARIGKMAGVAKLRTLNGKRGYLGVVTRTGDVALGDAIRIAPERYNAVPDHVLERLLWVIRQIPHGRVLPYDLLVRVGGAPRGYLRALPRAIRTAHDRSLPAHRVVTSHGRLLDFLEHQEAQLWAEGVRCGSGSLARLDAVTWRPSDLYRRMDMGSTERVRAAGLEHAV